MQYRDLDFEKGISSPKDDSKELACSLRRRESQLASPTSFFPRLFSRRRQFRVYMFYAMVLTVYLLFRFMKPRQEPSILEPIPASGFEGPNVAALKNEMPVVKYHTSPLPKNLTDLFDKPQSPSRIRFLPEANKTTIPSFPDLGPKLFEANRSDTSVIEILRDEYEYSNRIRDAMDEILKKHPHMEHARANAVILVLCRNSELQGILSSMQEFEGTFNQRYKYPYLFLNNEPFQESFQNQVRQATQSKVTFVTLSKELWSVPSNIDDAKFKQRLQEMQKEGLPYGGSESYRLMCRFFSRLFYKVKELQPYRYYWRLEPNVNYYCKVRYDPLLYMALAKKVYAYTIVADEDIRVVKGLWKHTMDFMKKERIPVSNFMMDAFYSPLRKDFNGNHYWSNFEIADLEFYRSDIYEKYMNYLDDTRGFFYERYGDAPVHSLAVGMLLRPQDTHYFGDISYGHMSVFTCPVDEAPDAPQAFKEFKSLCTCSRHSQWIDLPGGSWGWYIKFLSLESANNRHWNMSIRPVPMK